MWKLGIQSELGAMLKEARGECEALRKREKTLAQVSDTHYKETGTKSVPAGSACYGTDATVFREAPPRNEVHIPNPIAHFDQKKVRFI